ncbi:MAG TPA: glutamyl-tRNA reductase [Anaeromyxobacter sp.]|nr:glutamyl-tRNA reductase [Anaeromyxobacter sp.]
MLVAVGLDHRRASLAERECLALSPDALESALAAYAALDGIDEVAVLSTCCRVEVFAATRCPAAAALALRQALAGRGGGELPLVELHGDEAFRHLVRVAASLESSILGEPQVLGQVKDAFRRAAEAGAAGKELAGVLGRALAAAKRVRTETAIGRAGVSWGHAAAALAEKVLGPLSARRVAVVGAGELARVCAQHLAAQGASIAVLNRTGANAEALAAEVGGTALPLDALAAELLRADVVVAAAPVAGAFGPQEMANVAAARRRPLVLVDLAMPRAIPAETARVPDMYLCDLDDLGRVLRGSLEERAGAVADAERIVEEEVRTFAREEAERRAAPLIQEMRSRASAIAREEVTRTLKRLGEDPEIAKRLDAMAGSIVSKLLHQPSTRLRRAVRDGGEGEALVAAAVTIFDLSPDAIETAAQQR